MSNRRLIFGGTFDPPHLAHTTLATLAAAQLECDEILFIPAAINPLKADHPPASNEHRLAMLRLAIADVPNANISTIELERPGPSYTVETLWALGDGLPRRWPKLNAGSRPPPTITEQRLLIGCDQALNFHQWKDWQVVMMLATPIVMIRPPWTKESFTAELHSRFKPPEAERWLQRTLDLPLMDISSTEIRRRIKAGEPASGMLHPAVEAYISAHGLYR